MIAYMKGIVASKDTYGIVLEVDGIGYELQMSTNAIAKMPATGGTAQVFTYLQVKDDGLALFGFSDMAEKGMFQKLIGVSGIGPKMALSALSTMCPAELASAVADGDVKLISTVPGIGKKTAQRVVLELQGVLKTDAALIAGQQGMPGFSSSMKDAVEALVGMGFSDGEVSEALKGCTETEVSGIVRYALKNMGGGR